MRFSLPRYSRTRPGVAAPAVRSVAQGRGSTFKCTHVSSCSRGTDTRPQARDVDGGYFDDATSSANVRSKVSVSSELRADAFLVAYVPSMRLPSFIVSLRFAASLRECVPSASYTWTL